MPKACFSGLISLVALAGCSSAMVSTLKRAVAVIAQRSTSAQSAGLATH
jgi:hypothetical protein